MFTKTAILVLIIVLFINHATRLSQSAIVENLPGFKGKLPFKLETGYIGVGKEEEIQLFYYFIESENSPEDDPLLLWTMGGPGCSALSAILYDIGPIAFDYADSQGKSIPSVITQEYSWTKVANIIFLDSPIGTGYSYGKTPEAYYSNDTLSAIHTYEFLGKWLINNPKYLKNPLYLGGSSYSGIFLPLVIDMVYNGLEQGIEPTMNMKGYILGNPATDFFIDINGRIPYAHRMGLLSDELYQSAKESCHEIYNPVDPENILCKNVLQRVDKCLDKIHFHQILEPVCVSSWEESGCALFGKSSSDENHPINLLRPATTTKSWCRLDNHYFSGQLANDKSVLKALHVREGTVKKWERCNETVSGSSLKPNETKPYIGDVRSTIDYHKKFTHKNCRALVFSGDHDLVIPFISTKQWIDSLKVPIQRDWRPWFVKSQVAGYVMTYANGDGAYEMTFATIKGAGHIVPEYKPMECLAMVYNWFSQSPL